MIYPLKQYIITQRFGEKITDPQGHTGIDFYQPIGTPVYAAESGEVIAAGIINNAYGNNQYGNCVLIKHTNKLYTFYAHLSTILVKVGMSVLVGAQIGTVGTTGNVTGPHLHFEVRTAPGWNRANFLDPLQYLDIPVEQVIQIPNNKLNLFKPNEYAMVANSILNMRDKPGYDGKQLGQLYQGTRVKICGNSVEKDGLTWYSVQIEGYLASSEGDTILLMKG